MYQVEDLLNGQFEYVHASRLKFNSDAALDTVAILPHVLSSETGMPVAQKLGLHDTPDGIRVKVRWKGLPNSEDTFESLSQVPEDVPDILEHLLCRKNIPPDLLMKSRSTLSNPSGGV